MAADSPRDYVAIARAYAKAAAADEQGTRHCKWVRLAARRHLRDLARSRADKDWPYYFSPWHAADACDFIEKLPHVEGQWATPTLRLEPWQIFNLVVVFGWRRRVGARKADADPRKYSNVYLEVARKNGKSALTAGVALYCLCCEGEVGPRIYIGATTRAQADKVFKPAKLMVERTEALRDAFGLAAFANAVTCQANGGNIEPINAKASTQDGHNPHMGILDELHAHRTSALYDVIRSAFGARKNPLLWIITTAGYIIAGVCFEQRTLVTKILDGLVEAEHYWGIIYTLDEGDNEFDPAVWIKANPNLGASVQLTEFEGFAREARASPSTHGEFKTKRLNIWTTAKSGHINIVLWKKCDGAVPLDTLRQVPCYGGLDLASVSDMCAIRLVWRLDGRLLTWGRSYLPEAAVEPRTRRGDTLYQTWRDQGLLVVTPGDVTDYAWIERDIRAALDTYAVQAWGYDPWNAMDLVNRLVEAGAPMVEVRQGTKSMNAPMKELDRAYLGGLLAHGGDPVLNWCASNVVARKDPNDNLAPDKKSSMDKIDAYVALLIALALALEPAQAPLSAGDIFGGVA